MVKELLALSFSSPEYIPDPRYYKACQFLRGFTTALVLSRKRPPAVALRAVINNPLTCDSDVYFVLHSQLNIAANLSGESVGQTVTSVEDHPSPLRL